MGCYLTALPSTRGYGLLTTTLLGSGIENARRSKWVPLSVLGVASIIKLFQPDTQSRSEGGSARLIYTVRNVVAILF